MKEKRRPFKSFLYEFNFIAALNNFDLGNKQKMNVTSLTHNTTLKQ